MSSQPTSQLTLDFGPPPPPSLDNFAAGNNLECLTALRNLADSLMKGEQPEQRVIYVWGPAGSGKSHLAQALENLRCPRLMVVDDVNRYSKERQRTLFHRFNELVDKPDHALVVFGDQPPAHLKKMLPELVSRLSWGMVFGLSPLDDEALADALAQTAKERGLIFGTDLSTYLLRHTRRDMASLKAILDGLDRLTLERKRPLTLPLLRSYLQAQAERPQSS
ncbi:MAG: DnaA/Hda family protein [Lautropia sp.]|nr:DnaA/Hda family protein [Lautropia sp.]